MNKIQRFLIGIPVSFTLLLAWFAWSAFKTAPLVAGENLRGAGLAISAAIEQLAVADNSLKSLARYTTPDIAYFALIDRQGKVRFHTSQALIGQSYAETVRNDFFTAFAEQRERLGTGEIVYQLRTRVHLDQGEHLLVLALHTYRSDQVIRRAKTGVMVISALTVAIWGLTLLLFVLFRREERHHTEMTRREELARLGEMGALLAHEIRNPLAGIKGFAQLAETATELDQAHHHAKIIIYQSLRMEALVDDLLTFARNDHGERKAADISAMVLECVNLVQDESQKQNVRINLNVPPRIIVHVVADRIIQLLLNLLKNAIQAMPDGGLLSVELQKEGRQLNLRVMDTGIGIPTEHLQQIFEPFWTSKAKGTGLGLALCRKVAEEHGGYIDVKSMSGSGTEFSVILPVDKRF